MCPDTVVTRSDASIFAAAAAAATLRLFVKSMLLRQQLPYCSCTSLKRWSKHCCRILPVQCSHYCLRKEHWLVIYSAPRNFCVIFSLLPFCAFCCCIVAVLVFTHVSSRACVSINTFRRSLKFVSWKMTYMTMTGVSEVCVVSGSNDRCQ